VPAKIRQAIASFPPNARHERLHSMQAAGESVCRTLLSARGATLQDWRTTERVCATGGNEQGAAKFLAVAALRCESLWASCANQTDNMRMVINGRRRNVPSSKKGPRAWGGASSRRDRSGLGRLARSRLVTTQSIFIAATRAALLCSELHHSVSMLQCERVRQCGLRE